MRSEFVCGFSASLEELRRRLFELTNRVRLCDTGKKNSMNQLQARAVAIIFALAACGLGLVPRSPAVPSPLQTGDEQATARGKLVFEKSGCFVCHGNEGSGGTRNRNSATGEAVPKLTYVSRGYTIPALKERIRRGSVDVKKLNLKSFTPPVSMPPFRARLSEGELDDLVAYLKSLTPEQGEEPRLVSKERPPVPEYMLAGDSCSICHGIVARKFQSGVHAIAHTSQTGDSTRFVCVRCHGDGRDHAKKYGDPAALVIFTKESSTTLQEKNAQCLNCHERGNRVYWNGSLHETKGMACVDCHTMMEPASPRNLLAKNSEIETCVDCHQREGAQLQRSSHMPFREGKVTCSDCHNSHGTANEGMLLEATVNDNCYKCHAEKRGPFLWEHPPVAENCLNCHEPHGSNHYALLSAEPPRLCQRCHAGGDVHVSTPQLSSTQFAFNQSCSNCHAQIHGSNHPSGVQLLR